MVAGMRAYLQSLWLFVLGMLKRAYYWGFALLLDPFDVYDRFKPPAWPEIDVPNWLGLTVLVALLFLVRGTNISRAENIGEATLPA